MEQTVTAIKPNLVIMTAQNLFAAAGLLETAELLRTKNVPLGFGGRIFKIVPGLRQRIPGFSLGENIEGAPGIVDQLMTARPIVPPAIEVPHSYCEALEHFRERQSLIEAEIWQRMAGTGIQADHLTNANQTFGRNIVAALILGDVTLLCTDIKWVAGLLEKTEIPSEVLGLYLGAYHQAAQTYLDEPGKIVVDYLAKLSGNGTLDHQP